MADKLEVFNLTLAALGQRPLSALTDNRPEQRAIDRIYDTTVKWMLERAFWKWACRSDELNQSDTAVSNWGYNFVYELPEDYERIVRISDNERLRPTLNDFLTENGFLYADAQPIYMQYVSNDPDYGYNVGLWTASFVSALADELAVRSAPGMTGAQVPKLDDLRKNAKRTLYIAKSADAVNQPVAFPPSGRMVRARSGWSQTNSMRRTPYQ